MCGIIIILFYRGVNMNIYELIDRITIEHKTIFDMPLRVTFYARVSTKKDEQLNSQENQVQTFTELITNNKSWTFVDGYVDTIRGESAANRENFKRMITDAKCGLFDLIICKEISRFSRDLLDSISYTRELFKNNVGVYFTSDNLCTIDRDSELRLGIMASIAQEEVSRLSTRIKFGHKKAIESGVVMGNSRIYGYNKKDGKLVIDEYESKMVKMVFELYATGDYSLRDLSELLFKEGFTNHNGNPIAHTTIKAMILNPKYKGFYCGNKVKILDYRTKKQKFMPKEDWLMYKDETGEIIPPIVSEELWERSNEQLKKRCPDVNSGNAGGKRFTSPLSGKIICANCNKSYHHDSYGHDRNNIKWHWICQEKKKRASHCPSFSIKDNEMIEILRSFFDSFIVNLDKYIDKYIDLYNSSLNIDNASVMVEKINKEILRIERKKDNLLDLYTDSMISKIDFKSKNDKLQSEINSLKTELNRITDKRNGYKEIATELKKIQNYFYNSDVQKGNLSDTLVLELSKTLIDKILVLPVGEREATITIKPILGNNLSFDFVKNGLTNGNIIKKIKHIAEMWNNKPKNII